ncbi:hypothetical protein TSMEX_003614 [Taenia solium]|eukprot:TsM_000125600 transcript=TsM_000125600 gene=TsM_000125600
MECFKSYLVLTIAALAFANDYGYYDGYYTQEIPESTNAVDLTTTTTSTINATDPQMTSKTSTILLCAPLPLLGALLLSIN